MATETTTDTKREKKADFAIFENGGKQYLAHVGERIKLEKIADKEVDDIVEFDSVLLLSDGTTATVGAPTLDGKKVSAKILEQGRDKKLHVIRFRPKSRYRRKLGHRQPYTLVEIISV